MKPLSLAPLPLSLRLGKEGKRAKSVVNCRYGRANPWLSAFLEPLDINHAGQRHPCWLTVIYTAVSSREFTRFRLQWPDDRGDRREKRRANKNRRHRGRMREKKKNVDVTKTKKQFTERDSFRLCNI